MSQTLYTIIRRDLNKCVKTSRTICCAANIACLRWDGGLRGAVAQRVATVTFLENRVSHIASGTSVPVWTYVAEFNPCVHEPSVRTACNADSFRHVAPMQRSIRKCTPTRPLGNAAKIRPSRRKGLNCVDKTGGREIGTGRLCASAIPW